MTATQPEGLDMTSLTDEQINALIAEHSEWTPQGYAIVDSHRTHFARALLAAAPAQSDNAEEDAYVINRLSIVLAEVAAALMGDDADGSAADVLAKLPEAAQTLKIEVELYRANATAAPAQSAEPVGYLYTFANAQRPHDPIKRFSTYRFKKPDSLDETIVSCVPLYAAPQPSPTAVVLDARAAFQSIIDAGRSAKPKHMGGIGENTVYLTPEMYVALGQAPISVFESALAELVNKIDTGLDTGDLLKDAKRASAALDSILSGGDLVACAHEYFRDSGDRYEKSIEFRIGWNACLDAIVQARPAPSAVVLDDERAAFLTWWCADVPEYMREKWKESVDECLRNSNATDKLVGAWEGFQYALTLARAASTQPVEQTAEPVAYTTADRLKRIAERNRHVDTMWPASMCNEGDIPLYTALYTVAQPVEQTRALTEKDMDKLGSILFTRFYTDTEFDRWSEANQKTKVVFINVAKAILTAARPASGETET
jgi:hypothetical protein